MKYQVVIAGIGGQGTLFATKIFTEIARLHGFPVLGSENHGMSQRGGSVVSHLKLGEFHSPMIREGDADLLLGLDALEASRNLPFLRAANGGHGALCVVNAPALGGFPDPGVAAILDGMGVQVCPCPADAIAMELGNPLTANLVLLGLATSQDRFPFTYEEVRDTLEGLSAPSFRAPNLAALERGSRFSA
ncbi:MAG: 2-oxoacid:acceptor oxidoreductase family protein [Deferrisomatales bacterium]|nr:2-oxoacid:acceptor oxidoreductase family protein [Deferrisomatales bacterium]